jgi:hypothetical protein
MRTSSALSCVDETGSAAVFRGLSEHCGAVVGVLLPVGTPVAPEASLR